MSSFFQNVLSHNNKSHPSPASFRPYSDDLALDQIPNRSSLPSLTPSNRFSAETGAAPPETSSPIMPESASNHTRRRSSSAASGNKPSGLGKSSKRRWRRPGEIAEADEDRREGEGEEGSDSTDRSGGSELEGDNAEDDSGLEDDEETGLTAGERRRRRTQKRRNTRLDDRVAGEMKITKEEEKIANRNVIRASLINVTLIGLWYVL
jgi:solute carrier family 35, member C2